MVVKLFVGSTCYSAFIFRMAPGTASSLFIFLLFLFFPVGFTIQAVIFILCVGGHFICFPYFVEKYGKDDPSLYTLDEAIAMIALSFYSSNEAIVWFCTFILFRFFDIVKPLGIRKLENAGALPLSIRNVADDFLAALYTFLILVLYEWII
jgi:phosphatidylglycerophosphatase A